MAKKTVSRSDEKRSKVSQTEFPSVGIDEATKIAQGLWDNFAGKSAAPHDVALALEVSPTSSSWRNLCGASLAYGLTDGGYAAPSIILTPLGRRIVAPLEEGDDHAALSEAVLKPRILKEFFTKYDRAKFPKDDIAANVLVGFGLPKERSSAALNVLKENGKRVGIIKETKTGPFVALGASPSIATSNEISDDAGSPEIENGAVNVEAELNSGPKNLPGTLTSHLIQSPNVNKVFITHGKNTKIMEQIKKLVSLGGFDPVVSVQRETAAKPVPEKVMDDMRSCGAAVINVALEGAIVDTDGIEHPQLNSNVLIEIGAAMALYRGRFILVVEDGAKLPSNLQGLYECRYEGSSLDMDAGMKILEALRGLK